MFKNESDLMHFVDSALKVIARPAKLVTFNNLVKEGSDYLLDVKADSVEYRFQFQKIETQEGVLERWICKVWKRTDPTGHALPFLITFGLANENAQDLIAFRQLNTEAL